MEELIINKSVYTSLGRIDIRWIKEESPSIRIKTTQTSRKILQDLKLRTQQTQRDIHL
jgi:hypothetical protein